MMLRPTPAARASPATVGAVDALLARTLRASRRRASVFARRRACGVDRSVSDAIGISFVELGQDAERFLDACRSEEHTSELQSLMRISYAVFCLNTKHLSSKIMQATQFTPVNILSIK